MSATNSWARLAGFVVLILSSVPACSSRAENLPAADVKPAGRLLQVASQRLADVPEQDQYRTIADAAKAAQPGDTVMIHDGIYREEVVVETSGTAARPIRFTAASDARVIVWACSTRPL